MSSQDWAQFLCASPHRLEILQHIAGTPADTRDVTQATSGSRPSVQRHLNGFVDHDWVRKSGGKYHLTPVGRRVVNRSTEFITGLKLIKKHSRLLQHLPEFEQPFEAEFLADVQVVAVSEYHPHAPAEYFVERLQQLPTEKIVGICPVRSQLFDQACVGLLNQGAHIEVVLPKLLFDRERTGRTNPLELTDEANDLELYAYNGTLDFGLTVTDENTYIGAYEEGQFMLCMESGSLRVRKWAQEIYNGYRERSRPLTENEVTRLTARS